jgi:hypothetical protein
MYTSARHVDVCAATRNILNFWKVVCLCWNTKYIKILENVWCHIVNSSQKKNASELLKEYAHKCRSRHHMT